MKRILSQFIFNRLIKSKKDSLFGKIIYKLFFNIRKIFIQKNDLLIKYNLYNRIIELPLSHDLPVNKKFFPLYSDNIKRISEYLQKKFKNLYIIDIGANVGDTAFIINSKINPNILCIEGDERYFSILQKNVKKLENVFARMLSSVIKISFLGNMMFVFFIKMIPGWQKS